MPATIAAIAIGDRGEKLDVTADGLGEITVTHRGPRGGHYDTIRLAPKTAARLARALRRPTSCVIDLMAERRDTFPAASTQRLVIALSDQTVLLLHEHGRYSGVGAPTIAAWAAIELTRPEARQLGEALNATTGDA